MEYTHISCVAVAVCLLVPQKAMNGFNVDDVLDSRGLLCYVTLDYYRVNRSNGYSFWLKVKLYFDAALMKRVSIWLNVGLLTRSRHEK